MTDEPWLDTCFAGFLVVLASRARPAKSQEFSYPASWNCFDVVDPVVVRTKDGYRRPSLLDVTPSSRWRGAEVSNGGTNDALTS